MATATVASADERYAAEVVASDAVAMGLTVGGHESDHAVIRDTGMGLGIGGAPLVHLAHRNYAGAAKSTLLRITLPLATGWLGDKLAPKTLCICDDERTLRSGHVLGFVVGLAAVSVVDAAVLAKKPAQNKPIDLKWRPDVTFANGGMKLTVARKF